MTTTMKVKGMTLLSRKAMFGERLGPEVYDAFFDEFLQTHPLVPRPILPSTLIPVEPFLALNDELVRRFFKNDVKAFWLIGELSADFFAKSGPYAGSFYRGDYKKFWSMLPGVWKTLYTEGEAQASERDGKLDIVLDCPVPHLYFEYSTLGFVKRGLEMKAGSRVQPRRITGYSDGSRRVHYEFELPQT